MCWIIKSLFAVAKKRVVLAAISLPVVGNYLFYLLRTTRICLYVELAEDSQTSHRTGSRSQSDRTGRVTGASVGLCECVSCMYVDGDTSRDSAVQQIQPGPLDLP